MRAAAATSELVKMTSLVESRGPGSWWLWEPVGSEKSSEEFHLSSHQPCDLSNLLIPSLPPFLYQANHPA